MISNYKSNIESFLQKKDLDTNFEVEIRFGYFTDKQKTKFNQDVKWNYFKRIYDFLTTDEYNVETYEYDIEIDQNNIRKITENDTERWEEKRVFKI